MKTFDYSYSIPKYKQQGEQPNEACKLLNDEDLLLVRISKGYATQTWCNGCMYGYNLQC